MRLFNETVLENQILGKKNPEITVMVIRNSYLNSAFVIIFTSTRMKILIFHIKE